MASISSPHFSLSTNSLQLGQWVPRSNSISLLIGSQPWKYNKKIQGNNGIYASWPFSYTASSYVGNAYNCEMELNRVDYLVQILHKSAKSFSVAIESCELIRRGPELANAWVGVDVHKWHKHIAYQAAAYALLKTAIEAGERRYDPSPVHKILHPKIDVLREYIESQLNTRDPKLVKWFKIVKLPILVKFSIPLFKRWSAEYSKSGVAVIILAISCCLAIEKLGPMRISFLVFTSSIRDVVEELMNFSCSFVSMDKLYSLASEANFEQEFLGHFGKKVLHNRTCREEEFWIGLIQEKLSIAFHRENVISVMRAFHNTKFQEKDLATLGLFAYLGRRTRLCLSGLGIKDLDEQFKDFLCYLECGGLFIYPELSSLPIYQLFMEVVAEEIGWLDFYAAIPSKVHQERRRSKQHALQAEKEIILSTVFSVCSDVFSAFVHFSNSTKQPLDTNMVAFLLQSQTLLTICVEDYWAAYDRSGELLKIAENGVPQPIIPSWNRIAINVPVSLEVLKKYAAFMVRGIPIPEHVPQLGSQHSKCTSSDGMGAVNPLKQDCTTETKPVRESILKKSSKKLVSTSSDIWLGTRLLFMDISVGIGLVLKKIRTHKITERERKKLRRIVADIASVIPFAILMLIPLSAVGHAAVLAAIKKYIPSLIPTPYLSERLDVVKQLNRAKKMEVQSWSNLEDVSSLFF